LRACLYFTSIKNVSPSSQLLTSYNKLNRDWARQQKLFYILHNYHFAETTFQGPINTQNFRSQLLQLTEHFHVLITQVVPNLWLDRFQWVCALGWEKITTLFSTISN